MATATAKVKVSERLEGVSIVAKELGVCREWVWMVRTGRGISARVEAALKRHGIKCKPRRLPTNV